MSFSVARSILLTIFLTGTATANAATIFQDNFDAEALEFNALLDNWDVTSGSVDVIGNPNFFDLVPGNGSYLDMDGTTLAAGTILSKTTFSFDAGTTYALSFSLAGNNRGSGAADVAPGFDTLFASIGSNTLSSSAWYQQPFATYSLTFTPGTSFSSQISFRAFGRDNQGPLLDNVTLSAVPVPPAVWLLGSALVGLVGIGRRKLV